MAGSIQCIIPPLSEGIDELKVDSRCRRHIDTIFITLWTLTFGTKCSRMDKVKIFKGCLPWFILVYFDSFVGGTWFQNSSYNNQSIHLHCKSINWFLCDGNFWSWSAFVKIIDRKVKRFFAVNFFFVMLCFCSALKFLVIWILVKIRTSENFDSLYYSKQQTAQQTSTCSKTTIETLEKGVKYGQR